MTIVLKTIERYWLACSLVILALITTFSLMPLPSLPAVPGSDKTHHFIAYGLLMFPVALKKPKHYLWIAVGFIAWSGAIELVQPLVNRYGEWLDLIANIAGLSLGFIIASVLRYAYFKT